MAPTIFEHIKETEKLLALLEKKQEEKWVDFRFGEFKTSLLYSPGFPLFVEQLNENLKNFLSSRSSLVTVEFDLLRIPKEEISKQTFRSFYNELVNKFNRDLLYQQYPELQNFRYFSKTDSNDINEQDLKAVEAWQNNLIQDFEKFARLNQRSQKSEDQATAIGNIERQADGSLRAKIGDETFIVPLGKLLQVDQGDGTFVEINNTDSIPTASVPNIQTTSVNDSQAESFQKIFTNQVEWREAQVEWGVFQVLFSKEFGVENYEEYIALKKSGLSPFTTDLQEIIRGVMNNELRDNFSKYFANGHITQSGLTLLSQETIKKLQRNPYFQFKLFESAQQILDSQGKKSTIQDHQFTQKDITEVVKKVVDDEKQEDKSSYSQLANEEFKKQLKQVLALSTLQSSDSLESIVEQLTDHYANLRSLKDVDPFELQQILPQTLFSVNIDEQNKIKNEINKLLYKRYQDRQFKSFSETEKRSFQNAFEELLANTAYDETKTQQAVQMLLSALKKTQGSNEITVEFLEKNLPNGFLNRLPQDQKQLVQQSILRALQTGNFKDISKTNVNGIQKILDIAKHNPHDGLRLLLSEFDIDGNDVSATNLIHILDAYALDQQKASELDQNLGAFLNKINPRLMQNKDLKEMLQQYVESRKQDFAEYTKNDFVTYSPQKDGKQNQTFEQKRLLIAQYGADVVALTYYAKDLTWDGLEDQQEVVKRQQAWQLRQQIIQEFVDLSQQEKDAYAEELGIKREQFVHAQNVEQAYNDALYNEFLASQPWNAPENSQLSAQNLHGPGIMRNFLGRFGAGKKVQNKVGEEVVKKTVKRFTKEGLKKAALPFAAGAGGITGGMAIALQIFGNAASVAIGSGLGGLGGAIAGFFIGGPIGALIGGFGGALAGGYLGYVANGGQAFPSFVSPATSAANAMKAQLATAAQTGQLAAGSTTQVLTASSVTIPPYVSFTAVLAPVLGGGILSILGATLIFSAFLPDASTVQVASSFSTDIEESKYLLVKKTPDVSNADTPQVVNYSIDISKKDDPEIANTKVVLSGISDVLSVSKKSGETVQPPDLPPQFVSDLSENYKDIELKKGDVIHLTVAVDYSKPDTTKYADALVKNDIKVKFKADGVADEANGRAQTCFGDCPQTVLPACWPITGTVWQPPCARGTRSDPEYNPNATYSHHNLVTGACLDAYDVGGTIGEPIYAMAPGTVVFADWDPKTVNYPGTGYGLLIKIDHGGFFTFYAHNNALHVQAGDTVAGGQQIGEVGLNGFSSGPHLHFEVFGLQDFIFQDLFGISGQSVPTNGPRCDEYYGYNN